jgi:hypothetical protein
VSQALTAPFAVAALVLAVAGAAKLRAPWGAAGALGWDPRLIRSIALGELALGLAALLTPQRALAAGVAIVYLVFAGLSYRLARRSVGCGCFGAAETAASPLQSILSMVVALVCASAAVWPPHAVLSRPAVQAVVLVVGIAGAAYGVVLAYIELPSAWRAFEGSS